jgi:predicted enzyme related to lactoylglutathione lyase
MEMKLEVVSVPVSDIDRAKDFYSQKLGFHLDIDQKIPDGRRYIQLTPSGSACSISLGNTDMKPGSLNYLLLVVEDAQSAYETFSKKGVKISKPEMQPWGSIHCDLTDPDGNKWTLQQEPSL